MHRRRSSACRPSFRFPRSPRGTPVNGTFRHWRTYRFIQTIDAQIDTFDTRRRNGSPVGRHVNNILSTLLALFLSLREIIDARDPPFRLEIPVLHLPPSISKVFRQPYRIRIVPARFIVASTSAQTANLRCLSIKFFLKSQRSLKRRSAVFTASCVIRRSVSNCLA